MPKGPEDHEPSLEEKAPEPAIEKTEKDFLMEGEKVIEYMRNRMDQLVKYLTYLNTPEYADNSLKGCTRAQMRDRLMHDIGFGKGVANEIWQRMPDVLEKATGKQFPQLKGELSKRYWDEIMKLSDGVQKNADQIVENVMREGEKRSRS